MDEANMQGCVACCMWLGTGGIYGCDCVWDMGETDSWCGAREVRDVCGADGEVL